MANKELAEYYVNLHNTGVISVQEELGSTLHKTKRAGKPFPAPFQTLQHRSRTAKQNSQLRLGKIVSLRF